VAALAKEVVGGNELRDDAVERWDVFQRPNGGTPFGPVSNAVNLRESVELGSRAFLSARVRYDQG
jgi:hypothetical protein